MTPKLALRDYQTAGITDLLTRWDAGATRVPLVLATGLGKTVMFADLAGKWIGEHKRYDSTGMLAIAKPLHEKYSMGKRVLGIAHTDELIMQMVKQLRRANPGIRVGIVKGQEFNETTAAIVVSSRQTLQSEKRRAQIRNVGLIIVDECHHAVRTNTYGKILEHFGAFHDPEDQSRHSQVQARCKVVGFTATLARGDKSKLSSVWEECTFRRDVLFGIRHGYLLDVRGKRIVVPDLDMGNVRVSAGDYRDTDIGEELERTFAPQIIARDYKEHAAGRKGIVFWPLVETAEHGAEAFNEAGIRSEVIHGQLGKTERRAMLQRLHTGETQVIHGVAVLTEGFDEPTVDVVVVARPTRSAPLYQQMVGRVLRPDLTIPASEREKALILDVVGAGARHDLRSLIDLAPERALEDVERDDLSLMELDEYLIDQETMPGQLTYEFDAPEEEYAGDTAVVEFDPLGRDRFWAQTPAGTWYVGAGGDAYAFLAESVDGDPGTYDVVLCSKDSGHAAWARATEHTALPLDMALGWAEEEALELGGFGAKELTGRKSAWRKREPSDKVIRYARILGIVVVPGWNAGDVSAAIDAEKARRRIDPLVQLVKGAK